MAVGGASGLVDALYILIDAHRQMAMTMQEKPQNVPRFKASTIASAHNAECIDVY